MVWFGSSTSVRRDDELNRININKCFELLILSEFARAGQKEEKYLVKKMSLIFYCSGHPQFNLCHLSQVLLIICCQNWWLQLRSSEEVEIKFLSCFPRSACSNPIVPGCPFPVNCLWWETLFSFPLVHQNGSKSFFSSRQESLETLDLFNKLHQNLISSLVSLLLEEL